MMRLREWLPGPPVPLARALVYTAAIVAITGIMRPDLFKVADDPLLEAYSILSMDLAMSRAFCDVPSAVTPLVSVTTVVRDEPGLRDVSARQIAAERAGSLQKFCETSTEPRINNENSLMWLDSWLWRLRPDLSINELGRILHGIRVVALVATFTLLLLGGSGVIVAAISWYWALSLLQELGGYVHHGYPFMLSMLLLTVSAYSIIGRLRWTHSVLGVAAVAAASGIWSGFAINMRTSHFPVYVALAALMFFSAERDYPKDRPLSRWRRLGIAAAVFAAGLYGFQYIAITRHLPSEVDALARHTIFHSVVIGLGVPESDLSRREHLTWLDSSAYAAAQKIDPQTGYLDQRYERALFTYYTSLWRRYPGEMAQVYVMKAERAGKHMLEILRTREGVTGRLLRLIVAPVDLLPNGIWIAGLYLALAVGGVWRSWQGRSALGSLLGFMATAALLLQLEATLVMSNYVVNYQSYLAFFCVFMSCVLPLAAAGMLYDWLGPRVSSSFGIMSTYPKYDRATVSGR